jgi:hypothetical protein
MRSYKMDIKARNHYRISGDPHAYSQDPYVKVIGKSGKVWLYSSGPFPADKIYVDGGKGSKGMGGRTVKFMCVNGEEFMSIGPWMTTADRLYAETGVDLREKYGTKLILSRKTEPTENINWFMCNMIDVVHNEPDFIEGRFSRAEYLAQEIVNKLNEPLFYFIETYGGASQGLMKPGKE